MDSNNFENEKDNIESNNAASDAENIEIDIKETHSDSNDSAPSAEDEASFKAEFEEQKPESFASNVRVESNIDRNWSNDNFEKQTDIQNKPERSNAKPIVISVIISSLVTVLICALAIGAYELFGHRIFKNFSTESTIIFRDGEDLRQKIDVNEALANLASDGETPLSTEEIARKVGPAVVGIVSTGEASNGFFMQNYQSSGSGIIISADGYIVTNHHVVENAKQVKVILNTNDEYAAKLIGTDSKTDLAVIKIEAEGLTWASFGSSSGVEVGETVVAIGNPLGMELAGTVTKGIISATNRTIEVDGKVFTLLQTDAAINSGNSGGALVNCYGEVIGINSVKLAASGVEGLNFAIPSDVAKPIIEDLMEVGYVKNRPSIGLIGHDITASEAEAYGLEVGILVFNVIDDSAAKKAGILRGDIIIECQGEKVKTVAELNAVRDRYKAGDEITLKIIRDDDTIDVKVILGQEQTNPETENQFQTLPY